MGAVSIAGASASTALAANDGPVKTAAVDSTSSAAANEALVKKLEIMEARIKALESQLKQKQVQQGALAQAQATGAAPSGKPAGAKSGAQAQDGEATAKPKSRDASKPTPEPASTAKPVSKAWPTPTAAPTDPSKPILGLLDTPLPGLAIGAYGEIKYGRFQNPDAGGKWQNGFDAHRIVLLPTYAITDNIIFNAEIEFEHGGIALDADDKRHGTAEIEQVWVDFKIADQFNWRSPGIDLVPIGFINQRHEPTQFYSVNRPEIYNGLIPSTFMVPSTSVYGRIADGLNYQLQVSTSIEDFGDDFDKRTDANAVAQGGYEGGINGFEALALSRPVVGDFRQLSNDLAYAGKLDFAPPFWPGFAGSISAYFTPNVVPRGAYADTGDPLHRSSLAIMDAEFRYRVPQTGLELRGEYARVEIGSPANIRANNDGDPTNNVGKSMYAYSGEIAYHFPLGTILNSEWEAVPFYRYTAEFLQTSGFAGTDANTPTGAGQLQFHTAGVAVFPSPKLALKATYQRVLNKAPGGALSDSFLGAVGFFF